MIFLYIFLVTLFLNYATRSSRAAQTTGRISVSLKSSFITFFPCHGKSINCNIQILYTICEHLKIVQVVSLSTNFLFSILSFRMHKEQTITLFLLFILTIYLIYALYKYQKRKIISPTKNSYICYNELKNADEYKIMQVDQFIIEFNDTEF